MLGGTYRSAEMCIRDRAHIPRDILTGKLTASYTNNEMAINREAEVNAKNKNIGAPPSYLKQKRRDNLEAVSYTHLDVYKRQGQYSAGNADQGLCNSGCTYRNGSINAR